MEESLGKHLSATTPAVPAYERSKEEHRRCHVVSSLIEEGVDLRNQARAPVTAFQCAMARIRWTWVARAERF